MPFASPCLPSAISRKELWKSPHLTYNYVSTILGGYIGIQQASDDWKHTPKGAQFVSSFQSMPSTAKFDASGKVVWCSPDVDNAGRPLYRYTYNGVSVCAGTQPSSYTVNNVSDMSGESSPLRLASPSQPPLTAFFVSQCPRASLVGTRLHLRRRVCGRARDRVLPTQPTTGGDAIAFSVRVARKRARFYLGGAKRDDRRRHRECRLRGRYGLSVTCSLPDCAYFRCTTISYASVPPSTFLARAGIGGIPDYGWGDRVQGVRYKVVNYQTNGNCEGQVMQRVGTWTSHDMFVPCAEDPVYLADPVLYGGCTDINWFTADNLPTPDQPDPVVYRLPAGLRSFFTFMTVMVWLAMVATIVLLAIFRKSRIIHVSQTPILALILAGCFYGAIRVSLITADVPTPKLCTGTHAVPDACSACLETVQRIRRRAGRPPADNFCG